MIMIKFKSSAWEPFHGLISRSTYLIPLGDTTVDSVLRLILVNDFENYIVYTSSQLSWIYFN